MMKMAKLFNLPQFPACCFGLMLVLFEALPAGAAVNRTFEADNAELAGDALVVR